MKCVFIVFSVVTLVGASATANNESVGEFYFFYIYEKNNVVRKKYKI